MMSLLQQLNSQRRLSTILLGLLSAAKIITDLLGWQVISNQQVNDIVNGAAALGTVITVVMSHVKHAQGNPPSVNAQQSDITLLGTHGSSSVGSSNSKTHISALPQRASNGYARPPHNEHIARL